MIVFWLAIRLALGRGSWLLLGVAAGIGLETKYSIAVPLVLLIVTFAIWRRDVLRTWRFPAAIAIAVLLLVPNLIWEAGHDWVSVHWFLHPPPSGSDETRPQYIFNTLLLPQLIAVPIAVAGIVFLIRERTLRPFGWTIVGTVVAFFLLGGKSYYALPALLVALAAGAIGFDRWASRRRLIGVGVAYVCSLSRPPAARHPGAAAQDCGAVGISSLPAATTKTRSVGPDSSARYTPTQPAQT